MNISKKISAVIWANIRKFQYISKMSDDCLASILGVTTRTLYNYHSNPEKITLAKIQLLIDYFGTNFEDLIK